jgi:GTP-binding protein HflX
MKASSVSSRGNQRWIVRGKTTPKKNTTVNTRTEPERAFLVAVEPKGVVPDWPASKSLDELAGLAASAGALVVGKMVQKLNSPSSNNYIGKGKLQELAYKMDELNYDVVILDDELSPRQQRNLEDTLGVKILDRTALILDIFSQRAQTREGRLQVELAQLQYLLPRVAGQWSHLERLGGGIGTRGPGEAQIETDRRLLREKIEHLEQQIESVRHHRELYRRQRQGSGIAEVSLVGYTNAGKSALFNALTRAKVSVKNQLFSTLDLVTRNLRLPGDRHVLLTDTVGFIHKLPPTVVAAFRATLEELDGSSLLVHVVDIKQPLVSQQINTVESILKDLHLADKPILTVLNKADLLTDSEDNLQGMVQGLVDKLELDADRTVLISAAKGWGLQTLKSLLESLLTPAKTTNPA